jgi:hypothetical protein
MSAKLLNNKEKHLLGILIGSGLLPTQGLHYIDNISNRDIQHNIAVILSNSGMLPSAIYKIIDGVLASKKGGSRKKSKKTKLKTKRTKRTKRKYRKKGSRRY